MERLSILLGGGGGGHLGGTKTPRLTSQAPVIIVSWQFGWYNERGGLTGVELGVDGVDEPLLGRLPVGVLLGLHDYDSGDLLGLLALALGQPADGDLG